MKKNTLLFILLIICVQHNWLLAQGRNNDLNNAAVDLAMDVLPGIIDGTNGAGDMPPLSPAECLPDFSTSGSIRMRYQCAPESECQECFDDAREKMDFFRRQLGRLNCIYQDTKNYTISAIAFGDGASGVHAMVALAWQKERRTINASFENLKHTYDNKYEEFLLGLYQSLMKFDRCENQHGTGDWYAKIGFIYYDMMKERYKRND